MSSVIQTFVFMDFGCLRGDSQKLTEVSLLAVSRSQYKRPEDIEEPSTKITIKDLLETGYFDLSVFNQINEFINGQQQPVCLISHNGHRFDFIVLKRELKKLNKSLSEGILCADSLYIFYDILKNQDPNCVIDAPKSSHDVIGSMIGNEEGSFMYTGDALREYFYKSGDGNDADEPPPKGYNALGAIYDREVTEPPIEHHPAANDVYMQFRISHKLGNKFLAWTNQIQFKFDDVVVQDIVFSS